MLINKIFFCIQDTDKNPMLMHKKAKSFFHTVAEALLNIESDTSIYRASI